MYKYIHYVHVLKQTLVNAHVHVYVQVHTLCTCTQTNSCKCTCACICTSTYYVHVHDCLLLVNKLFVNVHHDLRKMFITLVRNDQQSFISTNLLFLFFFVYVKIQSIASLLSYSVLHDIKLFT